MQILPDFLEHAESVLDRSHSARSSLDTFSRELDKSLRASDESRTEAGFDELAPWLADAPYNPVPEVTSPFEPQPVRLTPSETEALVDALHKEGVAPEALAAMADLAQTPGGPTLDMLINAAREALEGKRAVLGRDEVAQLESLAQKLAGADGKNLAALLTQGPAKEALNSLMARLKDSAESISVSKEEMGALAKALNLPDSVTQGLMKAFGDSGMLTLSGGQLQALLEPAREAVTKADDEMSKLLAGLQKNAPALLRDAAKREEMERLAGMREDRTVAQSRILMKDTATQAAPGREDAAEQSKQTRAVAQRNAEKPEDPRAEAKSEAADKAAAPAAASSTSADARASRETFSGDERGTRDSSRNFGQNAAHSRAETRAETRSASASQQPNSTLYATMAQGVGTIIPQAQNGQAAQTPAQQLASRAMEQVEQALLTANKNGVQRLEVALNPVELGAMTVTLTNRNGEITALIQPERAETAALILQQAERIRAELENQGFRVEKLDVQTQLADQGGQNWQGTDQHNATRDLNARTQDMERLRRLGRGTADASDSLAHDMQIQARTATVAGQGLHIVA